MNRLLRVLIVAVGRLDYCDDVICDGLWLGVPGQRRGGALCLRR